MKNARVTKRMANNCKHLQILRNFRELYLCKAKEKEIAECYLIESKISGKITSHSYNGSVFEKYKRC